MAVFLKTFKIVRNNWKKTTFGAVVISYGTSVLISRQKANNLMLECCKEAQKYGDERLSGIESPRVITVILNPAANKRSAKQDYEKYCEPLFHMAGIKVNLLSTGEDTNPKDLVKTIPANESIVIAGGDGTISETITGILRENEKNPNRTVGILPLGNRNLAGSKLFPLDTTKVKQLTDASMAVVKNNVKPQNVMKIEILENKEDNPSKPVYAVGALEWGAFRDAYAKRDKYWIYGSLREYASYFFNGYKNSLCWDCRAAYKYSPPCDGCSNCRSVAETQKRRWMDFIMPKVKEVSMSDKDYAGVSNEACGIVEEKCFKSTEVIITMKEVESTSPAHLVLKIGKMNLGYIEFVREAWRRLNEKPAAFNEVIPARTVELHPQYEGNVEEKFFAIDNEDFEIKPIKVTLLPNAIKVFSKPS